jgi:hypothetical protein
MGIYPLESEPVTAVQISADINRFMFYSNSEMPPVGYGMNSSMYGNSY